MCSLFDVYIRTFKCVFISIIYYVLKLSVVDFMVLKVINNRALLFSLIWYILYFNVNKCKYRESYNWEFIVENLTKWKLITGVSDDTNIPMRAPKLFSFVEYSQNSVDVLIRNMVIRLQLQPDFFFFMSAKYGSW